jgi:hypothetical protein
MKIHVFISLAGLVMLEACSPLVYKNDVKISRHNFQDTKGKYANYVRDPRRNESTLWVKLKGTEPYEPYNTNVQLIPVDKRFIRIELYSRDSLISSKLLKGRYTRGCFKVRHELEADFFAGPIVWALTGTKGFLAVDKDHNLVFVEKKTGAAILLLLPFFPYASLHRYTYAMEN